MKLLYPGYKARYLDRFCTKPFHTEYTTRYCNSEDPVLYSQVPKYSWCEPRRPTAFVRNEADQGTGLTYLSPPFAARMTSYTTYQETEKYRGPKSSSMGNQKVVSDHSKASSFARKPSSPSLPEVFSKLHKPSSRENGLPEEKLADAQVSQVRGISSAKPSRKELAYSRHVRFKTASHANPSYLSQASCAVASRPLSRIAKPIYDPHTLKLPGVDQTSSDLKARTVPQVSQREEPILGRVAPRPGTLLSKHPKHVCYVRDTCFFQPTQERKKHYYIVNPNWFSEQRVTIAKNNVFS